MSPVDEHEEEDAGFAQVLRQVARAAPVRPEELAAEIARCDLVGRTVGHFRVLERLGAGGMGVVYGAEDARLGRRVALKVLAPRALGERVERLDPAGGAGPPSGRYELLLREARVAAAVTHPNVAAIYAAGEADGLSYIAMEYVDGVTLRSRIVPGRLSIADTLRYARQIADGLSKAHERGVVHRDLKPDNVMIDRDDRIKILDFGLARPTQDPGDSNDASGTPAYMSPEQARGERLDARSDVFSFGVLLYETLTGTVPFGDRRRDRRSWTFEPTRTVRELRADAPAALCTLVARCLEPSPARRYSSGTPLMEAIDAVSTTSSVKGRAGSLLRIARRVVSSVAAALPRNRA